MEYSIDEVMQFVQEEDVKFIRLAFCDVFGKQKNISIVPQQLRRAFEHGIAIDASAIAGFGGEVRSDLFLKPDPNTLAILPWRPEHGRVVRMFCSIANPDGSRFACDTRTILKDAINSAKEAGYEFSFGAEMEFYLFKLDENGEPTDIPHDRARYMDIAPDDKGENVRREICLSLEMMGIEPESSHHEEGPGQNEIAIRYSDPLSAADGIVTFIAAAKTIAHRNGLCARFDPKPLPYAPGNGMHINMSIHPIDDAGDPMPSAIAGILAKARELARFMNPSQESYQRLGSTKAPHLISWSKENRSQLIRIPAASGEFSRLELRSPDPGANPYLAMALLIYAALDGIAVGAELPPAADFDSYSATVEQLSSYDTLPGSLSEAVDEALSSEFIAKHLPLMLLESYSS
ncbi:MAG: glutamine synthetase [Coriobacteriales bacterium]|nr:glutamine synthetase [Coriobacteriales bacterium]